jgi:hypothetical protein
MQQRQSGQGLIHFAFRVLGLALLLFSTFARAEGVCRQSWCWQSPLPQSNLLNGVWGANSKDVWAFGDAGMILHWDGTAWLPFEGGIYEDNFLNAWGTGPNDVWAVGWDSLRNAGPIVHWNGVSWQRSLTSTRFLEGIWGMGTSDVWASGGFFFNDVDGILLHFDGTAWSEVQVPGGLPMMHAIWGTSSDDVYVGGRKRWIHWDGSAWSNLELPEAMEIYDLWGSDTNDVWASGSTPEGMGCRIAHWDGQTVSVSHLGEANWTCERIWGDQANDIWVTVGNYLTTDAHFFRWDGSTWTLVNTETEVGYLEGLRGIASDDSWAVGDAGMMLHWNGSSWVSFRENPAGFPTIGYVYSVRGSSPNDVWAAGTAGGLAHGDGSRWSPVASGVSPTLNAIWSNSSCDVWFSGNAGVLLHWNGVELVPVESGTTSILYGLWGSAPDDIWAAGSQGTIIHWNGSQWLPVASGTNNTLRGISGSGSADIWVVGTPDVQGTLILHWDGSAWSRVASSPANAILYSVASVSSVDAWAAGARVILHWDGSTWSSVEIGLPDPLDVFGGILARGSNDVWFASFGGTIDHWDGTQLNIVFDGTNKLLVWIWGVEDDIWASGISGIILHHRLE